MLWYSLVTLMKAISYGYQLLCIRCDNEIMSIMQQWPRASYQSRGVLSERRGWKNIRLGSSWHHSLLQPWTLSTLSSVVLTAPRPLFLQTLLLLPRCQVLVPRMLSLLSLSPSTRYLMAPTPITAIHESIDPFFNFRTFPRVLLKLPSPLVHGLVTRLVTLMVKTPLSLPCFISSLVSLPLATLSTTTSTWVRIAIDSYLIQLLIFYFRAPQECRAPLE